MMRNRPLSGKSILAEGLDDLRSRLPESWDVNSDVQCWTDIGGGPDALVVLKAPDGSEVTFAVDVMSYLEPKDVFATVDQLNRAAPDASPMIVAPYLSPRTREQLVSAAASGVDLTGNMRVVSDRPALLLETTGADRDPWRARRSARSLKGGKAARIVRALCDFKPPLGVRDLAGRVGADPGYVSRVLDFLDREALLERQARGPVTAVDWRALIRRWSGDYSLMGSNRAVPYLEPRGLRAFFDKLKAVVAAPGGPAGGAWARYAVTGSFAAARTAPITSPGLAVCFVDRPEVAAESLGLHPAESGANVLLVEPFDEIVYERGRIEEGLTYSAMSQTVADLLTGPGRNPAEADALMDWMEASEDAWRS